MSESYLATRKNMFPCMLLLAFFLQKCKGVLPNYTPALTADAGDIQGRIRAYFMQALTNAEILGLVAIVHNYVISMRTLKRWLKRIGLKRPKWNTESSLEEIVAAILKEMDGYVGSFSGYRDMTRCLRMKHNLSVRRETVMEAMRVIDPDGVSLRRRHRLKRRKYMTPGPNFLWHIDGWDKLKPYGFDIHGCMDGFSRRLLWLEVRSTNKNPTIFWTPFGNLGVYLKWFEWIREQRIAL